ncbi:orphan sodium- and chloride-dependent neurotransmitter transporter NTT5 [Sarcophilus harrisii]|uniref:Solute carrier family 6 member 16 n=1 Tax=Sarcophilus harrisii TaxID=9305 RepID=G3VHI7_SARHA|nr:orphan sodium- and chloride-dependent neurotransmitter transporter NTT5 [Sarcophilus harrisii]
MTLCLVKTPGAFCWSRDSSPSRPSEAGPSGRMESEPGTSELLEGDGTDNRETWNNRVQYIMAQVGCCVGLGAIWRFPSLCHKNGGGAFLFPYMLLLFTLGFPLVFLEMALGQNLRVNVWTKIHPKMWGVGLACSMVCFLTIVYYNVFIAWGIFYLSNSFQYPLPWSRCPEANSSMPSPGCACTRPATYFWFCRTLEISSSIKESQGFVPSLGLCILVVWLTVTLLSIQGLKCQGKILCFSVTVPFVILLCFLVRSFLLEGSVYGLRHLMFTRFSAMASPKVWHEAGTQVFFNLGLGFGTLVVLSSYTSRDSNSAQDAFILVFASLTACLLATQVVFSMLGFRASVTIRQCSIQNTAKLEQLIKMGKLPPEASPPPEMQSKPIKTFTIWLYKLETPLRNKILEHVTDCNLDKELIYNKEGPALIFVAFAEAIAHFSSTPIWSVVFFLMIVSLGLTTSLALMRAIRVPLQDTFPCLRSSSWTVTMSISCLGFLVSLLFTQRSGFYLLTIFDDFVVSVILFVVVLFENVSVAWFYGAKRFLNEIQDIIGFRVSLMHDYLMRFFTLLGIAILTVCSMVELVVKDHTYQSWDKYTGTKAQLFYPTWAIVLGFSLAFVTFLPILVGMFKCLKKSSVSPMPKSLYPELPGMSSIHESVQDPQAGPSKI